MNVLVIGAAGMIGRKFCEALAKRPLIGGKPVHRLTMADAITPAAPAGVTFSVKTLSADISALCRGISCRGSTGYHLSSGRSGFR